MKVLRIINYVIGGLGLLLGLYFGTRLHSSGPAIAGLVFASIMVGMTLLQETHPKAHAAIVAGGLAAIAAAEVAEYRRKTQR